jgi:tetratricopeptide (TPR) repeat protein
MTDNEAADFLSKGIAALEHGHSYLAMSCLEQAISHGKTPDICSYLGYCLALNGKDYDTAVLLGYEALQAAPSSSVYCLNLGRTLLLAGRREEAIGIFRQGLTVSRDAALISQLEGLGTRMPPVFKTLPRDHFLNKYGGIILSRIGFR